MTNARRVLDAVTTEDELLCAVIDYAHLKGWLVHHCRPARSEKGYRTPVQGDVGFVDLVLVHPVQHRVVFAETKRQHGKVRREQYWWLDALRGASSLCLACGAKSLRGVEVYVWRPSDWAEIEGVLA